MSVTDVLEKVVAGIGGKRRDGQVEMAEAVYTALEDGGHLLVQAGTGTGKSMGYLVPVALWVAKTQRRAIVSTATLALQRQITQEDAPRVVEAVAKETGVRVKTALLKGWQNYACLKRVNQDAGQDALFGEDEATDTGKQVLRAREWALNSETGDRDSLVPGVPDQVWRQISVTKQECDGKDCPLINECFPEKARLEAQEADIVITNHAMLGVQSSKVEVLPPSGAVIIDEAHDLVGRVTSQLTIRIGAADINRIARMMRSSGKLDTEFLRHGDSLLEALTEIEGRIRMIPDPVRESLGAMARTLKESCESEQFAKAFIKDVDDLFSEEGTHVVWASDDGLYGAPLDVAGPIANEIFSDRAAVLTSATLEVGGSFDPMAYQVGLAFPDQGPWTGMDVGSPFDYAKQGIMYIGADLPAPGRDGQSEEALQRMVELIRASDGGALGLFSSRRGAEAAAEYFRKHLDVPIFCQGEDQLSTLVDAFKSDDRACLVGTLSLWQGIDVPGRACRLVIIDRIPFPRPDDPVSQARTEQVGRRGGNGFMQVSATHAAVLMAQASGRLLRSTNDKGVVAVFDSRLLTKAYGGYLRAGMPPMWPTKDLELTKKSLARLAREAD
ncbi:ATP-dependent DNA helicase [Flaviflexus massiliensis]|uniref:ATP-dependent DNA helicase n=1 Tax=Flaviflexus massiliensis TaxID=1522309 RepID=UPI0006D56A21|nr:ATP-dependent DNA helicase [Flaviflexus massiliensis]